MKWNKSFSWYNETFGWSYFNHILKFICDNDINYLKKQTIAFVTLNIRMVGLFQALYFFGFNKIY
jgi:hypothetical protein